MIPTRKFDVFEVKYGYELYYGSRRMSRVRLSPVKVGVSYIIRRIAKSFRAHDDYKGVYDGRVELDTHADTFVAGKIAC